ncbi:hypothetical protein K7887_11350 [Sutcliffiella horikoshii]|uniref:hypothetical protein n=1 Tax=Sutcliffiella horikoshii TaxID=79883 RepID=UPI001CBA8CE1|nr:hypothetical protein [Sutcliffiella horikoshii]UAL45551.1 hypothetical protein K7887_11350 [Sutcliffiella horikoshii]
MAEIWIQEEEVSDKFLGELGHHIKVKGSLKAAYFISEGSEGDYVERNRKYLQDFLITQNKYPLYLTFVYYHDDYKEFQETLHESKIDCKISFLEETRTYWTALKNVRYHPPYFMVKIMDARSLSVVLEETYWLPAQNEFYAISYSENLFFQLETVTEWGRTRESSVANFELDEETTFITIFHDGAGFYLYSNKEKYSTVKNLCSNLPKGTVITQINDTLVSDDSFESD